MPCRLVERAPAENIINIDEFLRFWSGVAEDFDLLRYDTASVDNRTPTFPQNVTQERDHYTTI